jgi:hypothetical protein
MRGKVIDTSARRLPIDVRGVSVYARLVNALPPLIAYDPAVLCDLIPAPSSSSLSFDKYRELRTSHSWSPITLSYGQSRLAGIRTTRLFACAVKLQTPLDNIVELQIDENRHAELSARRARRPGARELASPGPFLREGP